MTVEEVLSVLEKVAPVKLSNEFCSKFGAYDNSGIIINCGKPVMGALFSLDFSPKVVEEAIKAEDNLIVTHHPAIFGGITRFDLTQSALDRALAKCLSYGISVISMHLNFDCAPQGIDYRLMTGLGGETALSQMLRLSGGAYGRVYCVRPFVASWLAAYIEKEFKTNRVQVFGATEKEVSKIASFCGAGVDDTAVEFAKKHDAQVVVSSDLKHHHIAELVSSGITVIQITHYCAEAYGFGKIYESIKNMLQVSSSFFFDEELA